ncbi:hypothetical protein FB639_004342 [Coemansia asiatica]|nr:hypothetical protein FB639_004342 [Coemansia asiatica]
MAAESMVVDWALQFYCAMDDQDMIDGSPSCLGLEESGIELEEHQPWASPLNLHCMAQPRLEKSFSGSDTESLEPFSLPQGKGKRKRRTSNLPSRRNSKRTSTGVSTEPVDLAAVIYLLITAENARRYFAAEFLSKKQSQGSVADRSERWQHHFAKRNIAAETQFENALVALKELVVLQAIANPKAARAGELKESLDYIASKNAMSGEPIDTASRSEPLVEFDASYCLAILNLMFPLDPLHVDRRHSLSTNKFQQRYAFPLQHVPNPRMQLHQLLCEVEAWVNGDKRIAASITGHGIGSISSDERGYSTSSGNVFAAGSKKPTKCPAWLASARVFAWGQLKQSCLSYLHNAQQKIMEHHRKIHPWSPEDIDSTASADAPAINSNTLLDDNMEEDVDMGPQRTKHDADIIRINNRLLKDVDKQLSSDSTVIERIICHSQLVDQNLSTKAVYYLLSKK